VRVRLGACGLTCLGAVPLATAQTPGPPPVPLGEPMSRDLGAPGDPRPPLPGFESGQGEAKPLEPSQAQPESRQAPSAGSGDGDNEGTRGTRE
jgi:hypothetical protein